MGVNIRYDKIGEKRYMRTITKNGKILNMPINLKSFEIKTKKDLDNDFEKVKKLLRSKK